jgi:hypothetical protein
MILDVSMLRVSGDIAILAALFFAMQNSTQRHISLIRFFKGMNRTDNV